MDRTKRKVTLKGSILNSYIEGRVSGMIEGIVREEIEFGHGRTDDGMLIIPFRATDEEYAAVKELLIFKYGNMEKLELGFIET